MLAHAYVTVYNAKSPSVASLPEWMQINKSINQF